MADGRRLTAVQLQWEYFEHARKFVERDDDTPENRAGAGALGVRPQRLGDGSVLAASSSWTGWRSTGSPPPTASATAWSGPTRSSTRSTCSTTTCGATAACTTGWRPPGKVERLTTDDEVDEAIMEPPRRHPRLLPRSMHLALPRRHRRGLVGLARSSTPGPMPCSAIPMREPLRGTKEHVEDLLAQAEDAAVARPTPPELDGFGPTADSNPARKEPHRAAGAGAEEDPEEGRTAMPAQTTPTPARSRPPPRPPS